MPGDVDIGGLRERILRNELEGHGAAHEKKFDLYRVSVASNAELAQLDFGGSPLLLPRATICTLFANPLGQPSTCWSSMVR